jgi:hypothetical protein
MALQFIYLLLNFSVNGLISLAWYGGTPVLPGACNKVSKYAKYNKGQNKY